MTNSGYRFALGLLAAVGFVVLLVLIDAAAGGTRLLP